MSTSEESENLYDVMKNGNFKKSVKIIDLSQFAVAHLTKYKNKKGNACTGVEFSGKMGEAPPFKFQECTEDILEALLNLWSESRSPSVPRTTFLLLEEGDPELVFHTVYTLK